MRNLRLILLFLLPVIIVGNEYYPRYKEKQQIEELKTQFQELLFEEDKKVRVRSLRIEDNIIALRVNISNVDLNDKNKAMMARNSQKSLPKKICSSVGLRSWLSEGKWVSIDVTANGTTPITNVQITHDRCQ